MVLCRLEDKLDRSNKSLAYLADDGLSRRSVQKWMRDDRFLLPVQIAKRLVTNAFVGNEYDEFGNAIDGAPTGIIGISELAELLGAITKGSPASSERDSALRVIAGGPVEAALKRFRRRVRRIAPSTLQFAHEVRRELQSRTHTGYELVPNLETQELDARLCALGEAYRAVQAKSRHRSRHRK
jgi:hypothetical protein